MKKVISIAIYIIGICLVAYFIVKALTGGNAVLNPDSMLPFTEFERNSIILGLGFIPMLLSCIFLIRTLAIKERMKKLLVFIPGIITAIPFVFEVGMVIVMMILGIKDVILN